MRIQNNIMAINTHRSYSINNEAVSKSAEKLSSGYRINRAGDDAAGLAISEKMRAQIRGLNMATKNSQDAISLVQTAEGALQETHNILQRMRELSVQSASDTNEKVIDRGALQQEFAQLQSEIDDIASKTRFNDQNLIDGTFQKYKSTLETGAATTLKGATMMVDRAAGGTHAVKVSVVDVGTAVPKSGSAGSVGFGSAPANATFATASITVGGTQAINDSGFNAATISWTSAATGEHNGNTYTFSVSGSTASNMTVNLLDSNGNVVATKQNIDFTEAKAAANTPFEVSFTGVGTLSIQRHANSTGLGDTAASASSLIAGLGGQQITFNGGAYPAGGVSASYEPATKGYISLDIDGEVVKLHKGDTSAVFEKAGITLQFDEITDFDLISGSSTKFGRTATAGSAAQNFNVVVNQSKGATMVIQTGANQGDELAINIDAMNTRMLGIAASDISTREKASEAISQVNDAINQVSTQRAALGALQNRLDHKIANLKVSSENLTAAESRIRDVDIASEMTTFTKNNILAQAATAMLAQANSAPQNVLSLLR